MNSIHKEKLILNIIKFGPILFVMIISFSIIQILLINQEKSLNLELRHMEETFLKNHKNRIKEEIEEVYSFIENEKKSALSELKLNIKEKVYDAHKIATSIYLNESDKNKGHSHSKQHILESLKNTLGSIVYNNGRGYFFLDDINGTKLLQPLNKELEGKNLIDFKDAKGYQFVKKIVDTIKNKTETYDSYYWYKNGDLSQTYKKYSFYKYFEPLNLAIGTGEYIDDFENELKKKVLDRIKNIRYGDNNYIFVYDLKGNCLAHYKKELIGTNRFNYKDSYGNYVVKDVITFAKEKKEGFKSYFATLNTSTNSDYTKKVSYLKLFEDWGWVIGTGFYLDSFEKEINKRKEIIVNSSEKALKEIYIISIIVTLFFVFIAFIISKYIESIFYGYRESLEKEIETTIEKEKLLVQQSKMATMGEMIGSIAHQWKQPINLISMSNGLLRISRADKEMFSDKEIEDSLDNIDNGVKNLSQTIDDFRNFFNPNKERNLFNVVDAFDETFKLTSSQFKNNNIEIIKDIKNINLYGSQNELQQVLINLLKNAKEELVKKDSTEKRFIFIDVLEEDNSLIIKVKDNANGVPIDIIDKIFESYFTTKEKSGGSGIGLYICKQIIEGSFKGQITVSNVEYKYNNEIYRGAEFYIKVPLDLRAKRSL